MDDLKLFARNDESLCKLVHTVHRISDAVRMSLGIFKCAKLTIKRGKVIQTGPLHAFSGYEIPALKDCWTVHYLGFPEENSIDHKCCKNVVLDEFHSRLRLICTVAFCMHVSRCKLLMLFVCQYFLMALGLLTGLWLRFLKWILQFAR